MTGNERENTTRRGIEKLNELLDNKGNISFVIEALRQLLTPEKRDQHRDLAVQIIIRTWTDEELCSVAESLLALLTPVFDGHLDYVNFGFNDKGQFLATLIQSEASRRGISGRWV